MPPNINTYIQLKESIISKSNYVSPPELNNFVLEYAQIINSKRRCSSIKNLEELICLLEKRDYISPDNVKPLLCIRDRIRDPQRLHSFSNNGDSISNGIDDDFYGRQMSNSTESQNDVFRTRSLPPRVLELVSEEIGRKWKDLARQLGLREGKMNEIEARYPNNLKERVYACLAMFQENNPDGMEKKLLKALEKARRKDLRDQVEAILRPY
ncbi:fas-associated death domain protein [Schistocerca serialis cubense]|uniref:fas-associated death domain protein n=1 Tax=Schistocerca serialis cubense TaxID=2023355 RepID=UPI00214ED62F|nr:fas-associated death domain protein [Schistocerca serialis cubense]